ncbi:hypothetical protein FQN60_009864 [Etheostoma spectabile]|uniref:Charged multivesicular body protein 1a n=1 Tax=Etheostoma spectabile TaxID=54343 RepID=A0A5J5D4Y3_9PERO|nr:hypothetical protein FQN60_009864 [Etheostoma spectabile]
METAKIHAENAIRHKHQSINFLRMSARVDAVASRVSKSMSGVVKSMDATLKTMNLEKISALMDKLDLNLELPSGQISSLASSVASTEQDELSQRLSRLRDQLCAGMPPADVLEMVSVRDLLWGRPVLHVAFLQCRQHLLVLVPGGMVLAERLGSCGPVVLSPWPTCLLLHGGERGSSAQTHKR